MFTVRTDDVLNNTGSKFKGKEADRFRFINRMINESNGELIHRPTIICTDIEEYPEVIEYIREETKLGRMDPQLHGWEHKDYVHSPRGQITTMLEKSMEWFHTNLDTSFTIWATPWGGDSALARDACDRMGITLQTTVPTCSPGAALKAAKEGLEALVVERTILYHWWERGLNLFRLCELYKHGSWEAAKAADERGWFK